jgi:hypothetical protein
MAYGDMFATPKSWQIELGSIYFSLLGSCAVKLEMNWWSLANTKFQPSIIRSVSYQYL